MNTPPPPFDNLFEWLYRQRRESQHAQQLMAEIRVEFERQKEISDLNRLWSKTS